VLQRPASSSIRGILAMIAACGCFACGDTIMKLLAGRIPTSEMLFIRGVFVTLAAFLICMAIGAFAVIHRALSRPMAIRAIGDTIGGWGFQLALARMPYADLSAISQLSPLCITAASALIYGEKVGWRRWTATGVGLIGVLIIIRPGSSTFNWWALSGIAAVLASTVRDLATRQVDTSIPPPLIMLVSAGTVTFFALLAAVTGSWSTPSIALVLQLMAAGMFSLAGQMCIIVAMRSGDVSAVAPFRYTVILFAILSGLFVFGLFPDAITLFGILVVCTAGLYTFYREQTLRRRAQQSRHHVVPKPAAEPSS
jgi:drug/metabolite transporter (DMT)-like permease